MAIISILLKLGYLDLFLVQTIFLQVLSSIFSDLLLTIIVNNTNCYTEDKRNGISEGGQEWKPLSVGKLKIWLRIEIYMGIFSAPALEDYWKHDRLYPTYSIIAHMSLNQFQQIEYYLHIAAMNIPRTTENGRRLWYGKVDPLLDQLRTASHISNKNTLRSVSPCSSCTSDAPGAYNVNSSSGCIRRGSVRLEMQGLGPMHPDAKGSVWTH